MVRKLKNKKNTLKDDYKEYLKLVNLNDLQDKINNFRMLDFKKINYAEISEEIRKVLSVKKADQDYFTLERKIQSYSCGTRFYRVRKLNEDDQISPFKRIVTPKDMWIPPSEMVGLGRLNRENESLLYTSPMFPIVAIEEMKVKDNEKFVMSIYESTEDISVCAMGLAERKEGFSDEENLKQRMLNDFIVHEFIRDVGEETKYLYKISETLIKDYYDLPKEVQDAWCYPSVAMKGTVNVCFREENAKNKLSLIGIVVGRKENGKIITEEVGLSEGFETPFIYYPIGSEEQKKFFPEIIENN